MNKRASPPQRGQAIILVVFVMVGLIALVALAVDGGRAYLEKQTIQNVADSVALDGALQRLRHPGAVWVDASYEIAKTKGYDNNGVTNWVYVNSPPLTGKYKDDIEYIQVGVRSRIATTFGRVIGIQSLTVFAEAVSRTKNSEKLPILNGNALVSLAPESDCESELAFWIHGESTLSVTGGDIFINSNNPNCALRVNGSGSIRMEEGWQIGAAGGLDIQKEKLVSHAPVEALPISYPPPFMMPNVNCAQDAEIQPGGHSMSPGAWNLSEFPPLGVDTLEPGVYCVEGVDFHVKGEKGLTGNRVVIKLDGGNLRLDSNTHIDLTAPQGGDFAGLLLYAPIESKSLITLNLGEDSIFKGTILAPGSEVRINNDESDSGFHSQVIAYRFRSDGQSVVKIIYADEDNIDLFTMPQIQLIK